MLWMTKIFIFLWILLLLTVFVVSPSLVIGKMSNGKILSKRDVEDSQKDISNPDICSFKVTSNINYRYAVTTVSNVIVNPSNVSKEVSFEVILPNSAFVSKFFMIIKDEIYEAKVIEKKEAQRNYQNSVDRGDSAGLVQLNSRDSNLFLINVNIEPFANVTFSLTYEELLVRTLGWYTNVINVNPGQIVKSFSIEVNIEESNIRWLDANFKTTDKLSSADVRQIYPDSKQPNGNTAKILWNPNSELQEQISLAKFNGRFVVRYDVDHLTNPNQILIDKDYFVHYYAPINMKTLPKHVVFVLDISGSMAGMKIRQLKKALNQILSEVNREDYITLIVFSSSVMLYTEINTKSIIPATLENIKKATEFVATLEIEGGTNIIAALRKALEIVDFGQNEQGIKVKPLIIFLTDGEPTDEIIDTEEIIKRVVELNTKKCAIFSLAFGKDANFTFLQKLSLLNFGFARYIYEESDAAFQLNHFYKEIASPILSDVSFEYKQGQVVESTLTKSAFSNLDKGSELIVAGKLTDYNNFLVGNLTYTSFEGSFSIPLPSSIIIKRTTGQTEKLWAFLKIKQLLDEELISNKNNSIYEEEASKLSSKFGFATSVTSLIVDKINQTKLISVSRDPEVLIGIDKKEGYRTSRAFEYNYAPVLFSISDILWLKNKTEIKFPSSNNTYSILIKAPPNNEFQSCKMSNSNNTLGHCRHLAHCVIPEILNSFEDFIPYGEQCVINDRFVGTCCPKIISNAGLGITIEIHHASFSSRSAPIPSIRGIMITLSFIVPILREIFTFN